MQPSAPFKLEQSLSTDGISNQSTTQARGGTRCANEFRRKEKKRYPKKKKTTKMEPTSRDAFYYRFFRLSVFTF